MGEQEEEEEHEHEHEQEEEEEEAEREEEKGTHTGQSRPCAKVAYSQCGGAAFSGETCCPAGSSCVVTNEWVSLCQPAPATSLVATKRHFLASAGSVLLQSGSATQIVESSSELLINGLVDANRSEL